MSHLTKLLKSRPKPFPVDVMAAIKLDYSGKIETLKASSRRYFTAEFCWLAIDADGSVWVYSERPEMDNDEWVNPRIGARAVHVCYLGAEVAGQLRLDVYWRDCVSRV